VVDFIGVKAHIDVGDGTVINSLSMMHVGMMVR